MPRRTIFLAKSILEWVYGEVPEKEWDYAWPLGSTAVIITTVDTEGRVNAAGFATCVRVSHGPIFISFTSGLRNDTHKNVLETGEFCVNLVPFEQRIMEATRVVGLPFPPGVNELEKAGWSLPVYHDLILTDAKGVDF